MPQMTPAQRSARMAAIVKELAELSAEDEAHAAASLDAAVKALQTIANPKWAGRVAVRNDAARIVEIINRELEPFKRIMERSTS